MEIPGTICVLLCMYTLPHAKGVMVNGRGWNGLPWENWVMVGCYVFPPSPSLRSFFSNSILHQPNHSSSHFQRPSLITCPLQVLHYFNRALLSPLLNPSMSPIHLVTWASAILFNIINGTAIGCYFGGYGPTSKADWAGRAEYMEVGLMIWGVGLLFNWLHDDDLREIRRASARKQRRMIEEEKAKRQGGDDGDDNKGKKGEDKDEVKVDKVYMLPKNLLFSKVLFAHYLFEWIEWSGWWMMGGLAFAPGRCFLVNEIAVMLPRAVAGRKWYVEKFGEEKVNGKWAIIPGLI